MSSSLSSSLTISFLHYSFVLILTAGLLCLINNESLDNSKLVLVFLMDTFTSLLPSSLSLLALCSPSHTRVTLRMIFFYPPSPLLCTDSVTHPSLHQQWLHLHLCMSHTVPSKNDWREQRRMRCQR